MYSSLNKHYVMNRERLLICSIIDWPLSRITGGGYLIRDQHGIQTSNITQPNQTFNGWTLFHKYDKPSKS